MSFPAVDMMIWRLGAVVHACLFAVLVVRSRWREYPLFVCFVAFQNIASPLLYLAYRLSHPDIYHAEYWLFEALRFLLELAVAGEIFVSVWASRDSPLLVSRQRLVWWSSFSFLVAASSTFVVGTDHVSKADLYAMRGSIFTSFLLAAAFVGISLESNRLRLRRARHSMIIGWGLTGIALLELSEDFRFFTHGWHEGSNPADRIRAVLYACIVVYWIAGMWHKDEVMWPRARIVLPLKGGQPDRDVCS